MNCKPNNMYVLIRTQHTSSVKHLPVTVDISFMLVARYFAKNKRHASNACSSWNGASDSVWRNTDQMGAEFINGQPSLLVRANVVMRAHWVLMMPCIKLQSVHSNDAVHIHKDLHGIFTNCPACRNTHRTMYTYYNIISCYLLFQHNGITQTRRSPLNKL